MKRVHRSDVLDWQTYEEIRPELRRAAMAAKDLRRIHLADRFTFLFENELTMRYQVQEMMRAERIVREQDILHEIETYNGVLGSDGELGCTLLIEIEDPAERDAKLRAWRALPDHLYARLADGRRIRPAFDEAQRSAERISSVQYLRFPVGTEAPVALGLDLPGLECEVELTPEQRAALEEDLLRV
jgi:hypothetical protein